MCTLKGAKSAFQGAKCDCIKKPLNGEAAITISTYMNQAIFRRRSGKALAAILLRADTQMRERSGSHSSSRTPRRESGTAGHTAEKVPELPGRRSAGGMPGSGGRRYSTPLLYS